jgi:hypothetical protein
MLTPPGGELCSFYTQIIDDFSLKIQNLIVSAAREALDHPFDMRLHPTAEAIGFPLFVVMLQVSVLYTPELQ